jgi:kinesin family protein 5
MEGDITSQENKGIIPRAVEALFDGVSQADENYEFTFKVSYVEIYLEKIRDLLDENRLKNNLTVREDKLKGIYIAGVTEEYVTSVQELLQIMHLGTRVASTLSLLFVFVGATNRATAATGMNEGSSRSHSIFTITVSQRHIINNSMKSGKLVLIDLAGSEMVRKTNSSGQQLEEAKMINKSLSALGQVINALTDEKATHIPYRDSKLTRVLQDSLGGNSKTVLIIAVSPSSYNGPETVSTLRFGTRAKSIENKVSVNQTRSIEELENLLMRAEKAIDAQTAHIISLTTQLQAANSGSRGISQVEEGQVLVDRMKLEAEAAAFKKLEESVNSLTQELDDERQDSMRKDAEIKEMSVLLREKERLIQEAANMLSEVQRSNEGLRDRAEQLLKEKIEAVSELESLKSSFNDEVAKVNYQKSELELSLGTLKTENKQLKTEIAELSGDLSDSVTEESRSKTAGKKNIVSAVSNVEEEDSHIKKSSRRTGDNPPMNEEGGKILTSQARKSLTDRYSTLFASACIKYGLQEIVSTELFGILDEFASQSENGYAALEEKVSQMYKANTKRVRELEDHRSRLEKDLQNRIQNVPLSCFFMKVFLSHFFRWLICN